MAIPRIFCPDLCLDSSSLTISGDEQRHLCTVLRARCGTRCVVSNGAGLQAEGVLTQTQRKTAHIEIEAVERCHAGYTERYLELVTAMPKGSRMDQMLRSLTELGVGAIGELVSHYSVRNAKTDRIERVTREALKQCGRAWLPRLLQSVPISEAHVGVDQLLLLDPKGAPLERIPVGPTRLLIGPEGGLDLQEREEVLASGARLIRLASPILRIETAAVAAAACVAAQWEAYEPG